MLSRATALGLAALALAAACAADDVPFPSEATPPEALVTRTIVNVHADGTADVKEEQVTVAVQQAEVAESLRRAGGGAAAAPAPDLAQDPGCSWYSLKLFDGPSYTGNYICFSGSDWLDLRQYCHRRFCWLGGCGCSSWAGAVRSYWSGDTFGDMWWSDAAGYCPSSDDFWLYEAHASVSSCVAAASELAVNLSQL